MQSATRSKTGGRKAGTPNRPKPDAIGAPDPLLSFVDKTREALPDTANPFPAYRLARVEQLIPYANNARTHTDAQIAKIAASITEFGFTNPVLTDGKKGIVAGHGRVLAAKKLGLDVVPCIELSHLTAAQRRAYVLADNQLAIVGSGWDDELLTGELSDLRDLGFDLTLTGFDQTELDALFREPDFAPVGADEQGRLDERSPIVCPECGHRFTPA